MKLAFTAAFVVVSIFCVGQDYRYSPKWKTGETKTISYTTNEKEYKNGELTSDTTYYNEGTVKVLKETKEAYTLQFVFKNQALITAIDLYENIGDELKDYRDLKLRYTLDKTTGERELVNWEEAQQFMNNSVDLMTEVLSEKAPEEASLAGLLFLPIKMAFASQESMEGYFEPQVDFLFYPFFQDLTLNESVIRTEKCDNPFQPGKEITSNTAFSLLSMDKPNKRCEIDVEILLDLNDFIEMTKSMMTKMAESFGASDSIVEAKMKEIENFSMEMVIHKVLSFDYQSTWVTKSVGTATVSSTNPASGEKMKKIVVSTVLIED